MDGLTLVWSIVDALIALVVVVCGGLAAMITAVLTGLFFQSLHMIGLPDVVLSKKTLNFIFVLVASTMYAKVAYELKCRGDNPGTYCPSWCGM